MNVIWLASASGTVQHALPAHDPRRTLCGKLGTICFGRDGKLPRCGLCAKKVRGG